MSIKTLSRTSFSSRLSLCLLAVMIATFSAMAILYEIYMLRADIPRAMEMMNTAADHIAADLSDELSQTSDVVKMAAAVASGSLSSPNGLRTLLRAIPEGDDNIFGAALATCPHEAAGQSAMSMIYVKRIAPDSISPVTDIDPASYPYASMQWFRAATDSLSATAWSEPYFDKGAGDALMVTCSRPVTDSSGEIRAVVTADMLVDSIAGALDAFAPFSPINTFAITPQGMIIGDPARALPDSTGLSDIIAMLPEIGDVARITISGSDMLICRRRIEPSGWTLVSLTPYKSATSQLPHFLIHALMVLLTGAFLMIISARWIVIRMSRPLERLTESAYRIADGDFSHSMPPAGTTDEMGRLRDAFEDMRVSINRYIGELTASTAQRERVSSELNIARHIQLGMLPQPQFSDSRVQLAASITEAREVGGDIYDYVVSGGTLRFMIADVSGKGVPAALLTAATRTAFRMAALRELDPGQTVGAINSLLCDSNPLDMFITLWAGQLDLATGNLRFCNAGHTPPYVCHSGRYTPLRQHPNLPAGVMRDHRYETDSIRLHSGDSLVAYTDGISEAEDATCGLFGFSRLEEALNACPPDATPMQTVSRIMTAVRAYTGDTTQNDDMAIFALRYLAVTETAAIAGSPAGHRLTLRADTQATDTLREWIDSLSDKARIDAATTFNMQLVMEEAVSNIIRHSAHSSGEPDTITIDATISGDALQFTVSDSGAPFNPLLEAPPADISSDAIRRPVGGLGIFLIRKIADSVTYRRSERQNHLTITFNLPS